MIDASRNDSIQVKLNYLQNFCLIYKINLKNFKFGVFCFDQLIDLNLFSKLFGIYY